MIASGTQGSNIVLALPWIVGSFSEATGTASE